MCYLPFGLSFAAGARLFARRGGIDAREHRQLFEVRDGLEIYGGPGVDALVYIGVWAVGCRRTGGADG